LKYNSKADWKYNSGQTYSSPTDWRISASWGHPETPQASQHNDIEGFNGGSKLGQHYARDASISDSVE